ncbi:class F sortase [Actinoplanes sp. NEAU-A12]|uniref:Class F sortase n=1 Tax=Actinoplanes sandaracinus TaxID=3045177 RepID=A0ABT6WBH6_9ACTN|nr:class F sortase [Actinoplanes sandaracinus]MDI6097085.1 class F sortase [Actinoplanes sandaracinus]
MTVRLPPVRDRRAAALAAVLAVLGGLTVVLGLRTEDAAPPPLALVDTSAAETPAPPATAAPPPKTPPSADAAPAISAPGSPAPTGMAKSVPVRLEIPAIGVDAEVMSLGLQADGTLQVPPLRGDAPAGWYRHSPTPGEVGASVLAGHVDSARDGPAVFYRLREVRPGDPIAVRRTDGTVARFLVTRVASYPKRDFPSQEVYAAVDRPALRLITCGGVFDRGEGSYRSNVVVFAEGVT